MKLSKKIFWCGLCLLAMIGLAVAAAITNRDSNQPRGAATGQVNQAGQRLDPIIDSFRHPTHRGDAGLSPFNEWAGNTMANAMRDPAFLAELASANNDLIKLLNALYFDANPANQQKALALISQLGLRFGQAPGANVDIYPAAGKLQPEEKLPVVADLCLRCHTPGGWLEGKSEPATVDFPFLKGQFWGAAFSEYPGHAVPLNAPASNAYLDGTPRLAQSNGQRGLAEAEGEMEGVSCDFCHRATDNFKRISRYDASEMAAGNGGFFISTKDPSGTQGIGHTSDFIKTGTFCGTCHDVTNPVLKTATPGPNGVVPDMLHPIERTYTEWFWSDFRKTGIDCQECHKPMEFQGAQTWLLYPSMTNLWGPVNALWTQPPFNYNVPYSREQDYRAAADRNAEFMRRAATLQITQASVNRSTGQASVTVRVTNRTGHKLPTGFAEGRQMWVHIAMESNGAVSELDGQIDQNGTLHSQKIYEQIALAEGYDNLAINGKPILDGDDANNTVETEEKKFHFVLMNNIIKDNRIPPKGFNKAAYQADGAFIVPANLYASGQNWDDTTFNLNIPAQFLNSAITFKATLRYRTFDEKYVNFLKEHGNEPTVKHGGRARNIPDAPGTQYGHLTNWGDVIHEVWSDAGNGRPVNITTASRLVN